MVTVLLTACLRVDDEVRGMRHHVMIHPGLIQMAQFNGSTALMHAAENGFIDIVQALLTAGADTEAENRVTRGTQCTFSSS